MSLLRKIQDATVDPDFQPADVLRMCQILAARLKHTAFQDWIKQELNGYEEDPGKLPDYRVLNNLSCRGNFIGPWGSSYKNAPIPLLSLPEEFREAASTKYIFQAEKIEYVNDETTPSFKRRVSSALRAGGEAAIDEFISDNKYLKVVKAAAKGWLQPGN